MAPSGADRLLLISRELAAALERSSVPAALRAAVAAAGLAVRRTGLRDLAVLAALDSLVSGRRVAVSAREMARAALRRLDEEYFESQDRDDPAPEVEERFSRARAASALVMALHAWTWRRFFPFWSRAAARGAACNAVYEAHAAIDDLGALEAAVSRALFAGK